MIRSYTTTDTEQILDVFLAATIPGQDFLPEAHWRGLEGMVRDSFLPIAETWVYEKNERILAFASILDGMIGGLFTHPDHQGKGYGHALVKHARGLHEPLRIEVFRANERALATYLAWGFVEERAQIDEMTGLEAVILRMD